MSEGVPVPKEKDYHGHPNYFYTYLILLGMFTLSVLIGKFTSPLVAVVLIFVTAVAKTMMVILNFMHLRYEPKLVWIVVGVVFFIILAFYWGVFADIPMVTREVVQ